MESEEDASTESWDRAVERQGATGGPDARETVRAERRAASRALVARLRVGEEGAYGEFICQHRGLLLELARADGVRADRREELVDDFMGRIAMKLARPTSVVPDSLSAYVATAFRRHLIDRARSRRARADAARDAASEIGPGEWAIASALSEDALRGVAGAHDADEAPASPDLMEALARHVERETTEAERRMLCWLAERVPQRLIAEWIGVSHGAARLRVMRLRARLRESVLSYALALPQGERDRVLRVLGRSDPGLAAAGDGKESER